MILGAQPVQRFKLAYSLHIQVKNENQIQQFFAYQQKEEIQAANISKNCWPFIIISISSRGNENKKRKRKGIIFTCKRNIIVKKETRISLTERNRKCIFPLTQYYVHNVIFSSSAPHCPGKSTCILIASHPIRRSLSI